MKKFLVFIISCGMIFSLIGCGSSEPKPEEETTEEVAEEEVEEATPAEETEEAASEEAEETKEETVDVSGFSQTLVDANGVKFEISGIDPDSLWGYALKVYLENNTDKTLMFSIDQASVNGVMMDPFWASEVAAGKKSNEEISWGSETLKNSGIEEVTQIEFKVRISDSEDFMADPIVEEVITIYPMGEDKATTVEHTDSADDIVLFDNDECKMVITGADPDDMFGFTLKAYLENKTDKTLMFGVEEASVNGFMMDPFWAQSVAPGKSSVEDITWMSSSLEENGIEKIESIEMKIHVYNDEDWTGDYLVDDTFELTF